MKDNGIRITIAGTPGSGKTTLANLLRGALVEIGLEVGDFQSLDTDTREETISSLESVRRVQSLRRKCIKIDIRTATTPRTPTNGPKEEK